MLFFGSSKEKSGVQGKTTTSIPGVVELGTVESSAYSAFDTVNQRFVTAQRDGMFKAGFIRIFDLNDLNAYEIIPIISATGEPFQSKGIELNHSGTLLAMTAIEASSPGKIRYMVYGAIVKLGEKEFKRFYAKGTYSPGTYGSGKAAFSPDSSLLALSSGGGSYFNVDIIDVQSAIDQGMKIPGVKANQLKIPIELPFNRIGFSKALCWSPDGKLIAEYGTATSSKKRYLNIYRIIRDEEGGITSQIETQAEFNGYGEESLLSDAETGMAFSGDSRLLAIGGDKKADTLKVFDAEEKRILFESERLGAPVTALAFSDSMQHLLTGSADGTVRIWSITKNGSTFSINLADTKKLTGGINTVCWFEKKSGFLMEYMFDKKRSGICLLKLPV